jgi:hypothetical protein
MAAAFSPDAAFALGGKAGAAKKPAKGKKQPSKPISGPHSISRQEWPPSIVPDYIGVGEKGYAVIGDSGGRLVIVDLKQSDAPNVISELSSIGKRVPAMAITMQRAYALAWSDKGGEGVWSLVVVSLIPSSDPAIIAQMPLHGFSEPTSLALSGDIVAVAGTGANGENQVIVYGASRSRKAEPTLLATAQFDRPITQLEMLDRNLIVVQADSKETQIDIVPALNPRAKGKPVKLKGTYQVCAKTRDFFLVGGQNLEKDYEIHAVGFKPALHVVRGLRLPGVTDILDGAAQKGQLLLLVNHKGRQAVLPVTYNKALQLVASNVVLLPSGKRGPASKARIVATVKEAYVASDWGGVQVLTNQTGTWEYMYSHTIPRLPAASVVLGQNRALLGGADLKVYDLQQLERPTLVESTDVGSPVRSMVAVGDKVVILSGEGLTMRSLTKPDEVASELKIAGSYLAYDAEEKRGYLLSSKNDKATVSSIDLSSDDLSAGKAMPLPSVFRRASCLGGQLLVSSVNDLTLLKVADDNVEQVATRNFTNLAIRDLVLTEKYAMITAIDQNSRGFLLLLDVEKPDLPTVGSIELPQDGTALAVAGNKVVTVGNTGEGKDQATLVDISSGGTPKVIASLNVVNGASAVSIKENLAVIVGRGIEIITLS